VLHSADADAPIDRTLRCRKSIARRRATMVQAVAAEVVFRYDEIHIEDATIVQEPGL